MDLCVKVTYRRSIAHINFRELPAHTESRLIGINFNPINNFQWSQKIVNSFPLELTEIKECHERKREEEKKKFTSVHFLSQVKPVLDS